MFLVLEPLGLLIGEPAALSHHVERVPDDLLVSRPGGLLDHAERVTDLGARRSLLAGAGDGLALPEVNLTVCGTETP